MIKRVEMWARERGQRDRERTDKHFPFNKRNTYGIIPVIYFFLDIPRIFYTRKWYTTDIFRTLMHKNGPSAYDRYFWQRRQHNPKGSPWALRVWMRYKVVTKGRKSEKKINLGLHYFSMSKPKRWSVGIIWFCTL